MSSTTTDERRPGSLAAIRGQKWVVSEVDPDTAQAVEHTVLRDRLARAYAAIRAAAPHAHVIVLGYPRLFELTPSCADPLAPNLTRRSKLNEGADVLDSVVRSASQQHAFSFTDVRDRFAGHGVCSANPWINGPSVPASVGPITPNRLPRRLPRCAERDHYGQLRSSLSASD